MTDILEGALNLLELVSWSAWVAKEVMLGSGYSTSKVFASFSKVPVAGSYQIQDPGSYRIVLSAGWGIPGLLLLSSVIPLPIFLLSRVFQLSQFWRLIHWQALGSGNWWGCCGRHLKSPVCFCRSDHRQPGRCCYIWGTRVARRDAHGGGYIPGTC